MSIEPYTKLRTNINNRDNCCELELRKESEKQTWLFVEGISEMDSTSKATLCSNVTSEHIGAYSSAMLTKDPLTILC